jgi:hypothetical protein
MAHPSSASGTVNTMRMPLLSLFRSIQAKRSGCLASQLSLAGLARVWLATALLLSASLASAQGITVAIGGGLKDDNLAVWSRLVSLAGGAGSRFTVFATASGDPERTASRIAANLTRQGAVVEIAEVAPRLPGIDLAAAVADPRWIELVTPFRRCVFQRRCAVAAARHIAARRPAHAVAASGAGNVGRRWRGRGY